MTGRSTNYRDLYKKSVFERGLSAGVGNAAQRTPDQTPRPWIGSRSTTAAKMAVMSSQAERTATSHHMDDACALCYGRLFTSPLETHLELDLGARAGPVLVKPFREVSLPRQDLQAHSTMGRRCGARCLFASAHTAHIRHGASHGWVQTFSFLLKAKINSNRIESFDRGNYDSGYGMEKILQLQLCRGAKGLVARGGVAKGFGKRHGDPKVWNPR